MKKVTLFIVICMIAAFVIAADSENVQRQAVPERTLEQPRMPAPVSALRSQSRNRQQMYLQMQTRRTRIHQQGVAELEAIKKIAEEEEAVKTVAAIQAMITKKNTEFKESQAQLETQRAERARQMQRRTQQQQRGQLPQPVDQKNDAAGNPAQNDN